MKRIILTVAAFAVTTFGVVAAVAPAGAATVPGTVKANTHQIGVADTTDHAGPNTTDTPGGPVWAYDNLERKITATPTGNLGEWQVVIASQGSYSAFADPRTGGPASFTSGPVSGEVDYTVQAGSLQPSGGNLAAQSPLSLHSGDLMNAMFGGTVQVEHSSYDFTYRLAGAVYEQVG
ncbi:MAG: hypothetical protein ACTHPS_28885 [Streptosporangiaceae bacterium]